MEASVTMEKEPQAGIKTKMHLTGKVAKVSLAGAVIDVGSDKPAVIHISQLPPQAENEPLKRVGDMLEVGQEIEVWVRRVKEDHIELTMIKPLDLEWRDIKKGMTVNGKVVRLEKFGVFVEIGAERPGLVHISELAHGYVRSPGDVVKEGDEVEAQVIEVNRRKKQIKLSLKALQPEPEVEEVIKLAESHPPKEKAARRRKTGRKTDASEFTAEGLSEESKAEAEPTAMEIALRQAMERAQNRKQEKNKKNKQVSNEQEDILSRTLEQKVNTAKS